MSKNTEQRLFTAVCLAENNQGRTPNELTVPLLESEFLDNEASRNQQEAKSEQVLDGFMTRCRLMGLFLGFLVQIINVLGTTYMYMRWGDSHVSQGSREGEADDWLIHWVVWLTAQADIYVYFTMWISLSAALTKPGVKFAQRHFFSSDICPSRRSVFIMGVNFYIGVVGGVFLAWVSVDAFLGVPVSMFPMFCVFIFGLVISYIMVLCYDKEAETTDVVDGDEEADTNSDC